MNSPDTPSAASARGAALTPRDRRGAANARPARFAIAGGLATTVHWAVMAAGVAGGIDPVSATAGGAAAGAAANYALQRQALDASAVCHRFAVPRYLLACAIAWVANLVVFAALQALTTWPIGIAQAVTTAVVGALNFLLYDRLVFHDPATVRTAR
jgi:putative flippase GtrA